MHQAVPFTKGEYDALLARATPRLRLALKFAWKTASRWDEVRKVPVGAITVVSPEEVVVNWGRNTKTSRHNPFKPHLLTNVQGRWTNEIAAWLVTKERTAQLTTVTTKQLDALLATWAPGRTAGSIKRGAVTHRQGPRLDR